MTPHRYEIDLKPPSDALGGGYLAVMPELPGCRSDGDSPEEALRNVCDAIDCWIEAAEGMGRAIPEPKLLTA